MRRSSLVWLALVANCASAGSAAREYSARGQHELAVHYAASALAERPDDPGAVALVEESTGAAVQSLEADYDARVHANDPLRALAVATRMEELLDFVWRLGVESFDPARGARRVQEAMPLASQALLARIDAADAQGGDMPEQLAVLRQALALTPNDAELQARYRRQRERLSHRVAVTSVCGQAQDTCHELANRVIARALAGHPELLRLVRSDSEQKDSELVIEATLRDQWSPWQRLEQSTASARIERRDEFQEIVKDKNGRAQFDEVHATYSVFESRARLEVDFRVRLRDLREGHADLMKTEFHDVAETIRHYVSWQGDERAMQLLIGRYGTDETPAPKPALLLPSLVDKAAAAFAQRLLAKLEV